MEPIINPTLIYLVGFCGDLKEFLFIAFFLSAIPTIWYIVMFLLSINDKKENEYNNKRVRGFVILSFVLWLLFAIIPSRQTALAMLATYYITPDNVQIVQGNVVEFIRQIVQAVEVVK